MAGLKSIRWKSVRNEYRDASAAGKEAVVADVADELKPVLQRFSRKYGATGNLPRDKDLHGMVRKALAVNKGRSAGERFAHEYLGEFDFVIAGTALGASRSLVKSTIRTLAKRRKRI
jgi:hypothetical protein